MEPTPGLTTRIGCVMADTDIDRSCTVRSLREAWGRAESEDRLLGVLESWTVLAESARTKEEGDELITEDRID